MRICEDPDILNILYIFIKILNFATIATIVILVIMIMYDIIKMMSSSNVETKNGINSITKRIIAAVIVFLVPSIISVVLNITGQTLDYGDCLNNANKEFISIANADKAEEYLKLAEENKSSEALYKAKKYINKISDENVKEVMLNRVDIVENIIKGENGKLENLCNIQIPSNGMNYGSLEYSGFYTDGSCNSISGNYLEEEPDPSCVINYWKAEENNQCYFIYPKDSYGQSLGAWPPNYDDMPTKINIKKEYQEKLIWPVSGKFLSINLTKEIAFSSELGTPVYAPASGTLRFSQWGQTTHKYGSETAYTVAIMMDDPIKYEDDPNEYSLIVLSNLSGIVHRCDAEDGLYCDKKIRVEQGELIGFVGTSTYGDDQLPGNNGFAPSVRMAILPTGYAYVDAYEKALSYDKLKELYEISQAYESRKVGE